ncbi:MAG: adenylate/guanylate cyclase domain-containing protein [Luteibaculum sp.]
MLFRLFRKKEKEDDLQRARSRRAVNLIYEILPDEMADDILDGKQPKAKHYSKVSIIFTDIKNFTKIAEDYRPQELVQILNKYFTRFDTISSKYGVERVKTIGDSFMGVAGCPQRKKEHAVNAVLAAIEIQQWIHILEEKFKRKGEDYIQLKIGINTGEVVAGIIGKFRHAFDVWGDSVNVAYRMQEACEPGRINITEDTYKQIAPFFEVEHRGLVKTKHKGNVNMYYVNGIKEGLHHQNKPNQRFWEYVNMVFYAKFDYLRMEKDMLHFLESKLPKKLYYHGIHHTLYVTKAAEKIALKEGVHGEDMFLIKTAAIFHDAGFIWSYEKNEELGANLAKEKLPSYRYSKKQIETVCELILATRVPQKPVGLMQRVICDADLFYLGNPKFHDIADTLFHELEDRAVVKDKRHWDEIQIHFLTKHHFHTDFAKKKAQPGKERHLVEIKNRYQQNNYPEKTPL